MAGYHTHGAQTWGTIADQAAAAEATVPFYLADAPYQTDTTDTGLPSVAFDPRVVNVSLRYATAGARLGGRASFDGGAVEISDADGELRAALRRYGWAGRRAVVKVGARLQSDGSHFPYAQFRTLFDGYMGTPEHGGGRVRIPLRGIDRRLDQPLNSTVFAGTGGYEGGADLTGKPRCSAWGRPFNVPAVRLNNLNIYEVCHNAAILAAGLVVRDAMIRLDYEGDDADYATLAASSPASGYYRTCLALGLIKLGSDPTGEITVDFRTATELPGAVARDILTASGGVAASGLEPAGFTSVDTTYPYPIALWYGPDDAARIPQAMQDIVDTIEGIWGERADGRGFLALAAAPSGGWAAELTDADVIADSWQSRPLPESVDPAVWRALVGYQRAYRVQAIPNPNDLANLAEADLQALGKEYRYAIWADTDVQALHLDAKQLQVGGASAAVPVSAWATEAGAQAHADRLGALYGTAPRLADASVGPAGLLRALGNVVAMSMDSEGQARQLASVAGLAIESARARVDLVVLQEGT